MLNMGNIVDKESVEKNTSYVNSSMKFKLDKYLTPWELRNFLFWVVMDTENLNKVSLIVQNVFVDNFPTTIITCNNSNFDASLMQTIKEFRIVLTNSIDYNEKNVKLNRWWKRYLNIIPKQPQFTYQNLELGEIK